MAADFSVLCIFSLNSSNHNMAAMATRTPGTTTRVIILPARRDDTDCDSRTGHRKLFSRTWTGVSAEQPPYWFWYSNTYIFLPRPSVTSPTLTCLKKVCFCHVISIPAEGKVTRWQKYWHSHSAFPHFIQKYFCMRLQAAPSWNSSKFLHVIKTSCQSQTFCTKFLKRCFVMYIKVFIVCLGAAVCVACSIASMSQTEKNVCVPKICSFLQHE